MSQYTPSSSEQMIPPASLINPPKPNGDHILPSVYRQSNATVANHESDSSGFPVAWPPLENNSSRVRRVSTLPYNNINRDSLDLSRQKPSRWLVLVLPPALLIQESRNLGQTLASGPKNRLSQGILMPLFPTVNLNFIRWSGIITLLPSDVWSIDRYCPRI